MRWAGRELELRQASRWRERYALAEGAHVLAVLEGRGFGRRPVRIALEDPAAVEPGLLLFSAFVVRAIAQDARAAAGAGASAG